MALGYGFNPWKKTFDMCWTAIPHRFAFRTEGHVRAFCLVVRQLPYVQNLIVMFGWTVRVEDHFAVVITNTVGAGPETTFQVYKRVEILEFSCLWVILTLRVGTADPA